MEKFIFTVALFMYSFLKQNLSHSFFFAQIGVYYYKNLGNFVVLCDNTHRAELTFVE